MVLCPVIGKLLHKRVVLASASPRRQEILSNAGLRFEVVPSRFKETLSKAAFPSPFAYAMETAKQKALEVAQRMHQKDLRTPDVVIGADTIVAVEGQVLEKPVDKQDAYDMLSRLSGKEHSVFTGVAIVSCTCTEHVLDTQVSEFYEETRVKFSELSEDLLWDYIHSGEPMDKAGGYGIQALGGMLVEYVRGDFLNVVGFPLNRFCKQLAELYCPPSGQDVRRTHHDSIPAVDSFETLRDQDGGGPQPAPSDVGPGAGPASTGSLRGLSEADGDPPAPGSSEAGCNGQVERQSPFPAGLLDLIDGFKASKALFTACKLRLFDVLRDGAHRSAADVARQVDAGVCGTRRLLDVCVGLGLLQRTAQGYSNTELADRYLVSDGECSLHSFVVHSNDHTWPLFSRLEQAVREGPRQHRGASWEEARDPSQVARAGRPSTCRHSPGRGHLEGSVSCPRDPGATWKPQSSCFLTLNGQDCCQDKPVEATHGLATLTARRLASAFDLTRFPSACQLGGCTGALPWALARESPQLKVTVLDCPEVLQQVSRLQPQGGRTALVSLVPGDPCRDALPAADLYILPRLPPEWPDDRVHQLLRRVAASCRPGGGLLLAEVALDEGQGAARRGLRHRLDLLVRTPGRDWSLGECGRLLAQHGFPDVRVAPVGDIPGAVLGIRAGP
ncbi:probable bifunctional dTTP/UTP pyrophosphatase/methyltransferase protein [Sciurus carolinensis]|uniref:probable bifunctional dTTP/UTP pyrophosphatase/methyltransferase protein n=1 Tax=Sciurus carolinensis TaxID=30640 RepID=UPI001FB24A32|nr:probable bifunctional dTTP/UTP pyrophosphatase/methyltransferase protein [Sciurus carolinensis]